MIRLHFVIWRPTHTRITTRWLNLTDEESRIMPASGGSFEQCYNAQAAVDTQTMLIISPFVTQATNNKQQTTNNKQQTTNNKQQTTNNKQQMEPALNKLTALPQVLGRPGGILAGSGYFSAANVIACIAHQIESLLAAQRESHHIPVDTGRLLDS